MRSGGRLAHPFRLILATVLLAGCEDAIGFGGTCTREMRSVLADEGQPIDRNGPTESDGNYTEIWRYSHGFYVFEWGVSYEMCEVSGPVALDMIRI